MPNVIKIRRSSTTGSAPASLQDGEIAINQADGKFFWRDSSSNVQALPFPKILRVDSTQSFSAAEKTQARTNIGVAASGANTDITQLATPIGLGTSATAVQVQLPAALGDKIGLYSGASYGFGIQSSQLQAYAPAGAKLSLGYGTSAAFTTMLDLQSTVGATFASGVKIGLGIAPSANAGLTMSGTGGSVSAGPHIAIFTAADTTYPVFHQLNYTHDNVGLMFDSYYDGQWKSSSNTVNHRIYKVSGQLQFAWAPAVTPGTAVTWNTAIAIGSTGTTFSGVVNLGSGAVATTQAAGYNGLGVVTSQFLGSYAVRCDMAQTMTAAQQKQARANLGFTTRTIVNDANYTALATDNTVAVTAITAPRTLTLPPASSYPTGVSLLLLDESGACSATKSITVTPNGSDTISGLSSYTMATSYAFVTIHSTGAAWVVENADSTAAVAAATSFLQSGTGAVTRSLQDKAAEVVSLKDFRASADPDDTLSFQRATSYLQTKSNGGEIFIKDGQYVVASTIFNDRSSNQSLGRVSFRGQSENGTVIIYTGSGPCFSPINNHTPAGEQAASYQKISDMSIFGPSQAAGTIGIALTLGSFAKLERLNIQGFDFGLYLTDVDQAYFEKLNLRFNNRGLSAQQATTPGASSTMPNNHTYVSCALANNTTYGAQFIGASAINFLGGDVEYNGLGVSGGFGLLFQDCGYQGGRGANLQGVYFEANGGVADVVLNNQTVVSGQPRLLATVHHISSEFHRNSTANQATNNILCAFGPDSTVGHCQLVTVASSFKSFAGYAPNIARPYIAYSVTPANTRNFFDLGSYYHDAVETPAFIQNLNKKDAVLAKAADQVFASSVTSKWLLDTVGMPQPLWVPMVSSGNVTIDEAGTYSISIAAILSTSGAGVKFFTILRNGVVVGYGEGNGASNVMGASAVARFSAGDILSVNYFQATGSAQSITGATSSLTIVKLL